MWNQLRFNIMVVLRCPFCGEKIRQGERFCPHCGKEIDKPHIDEVDSYFQEAGGLLGKFIAIVVLWFVVLIVVGIVGNLLNFPAPPLFVFSFVLTGLIVIVYELKK